MEKVEIVQKQPTQLAATTGFLDQVAIENETVCLSGWVLSFESESVTNFKVLFGSQQLIGFELTQGLPSPGVKKAHPNISAANNARFIIRLPMNKQQQEQLKDALIILIPLVNDREGEPLLNAVNPALSALVKTPEANNLPSQTPQVELISVHVPKAAGTAFRQVLLQVYGTQGVLTDKTNMFEDNMPATIHWQTKVIEGHFRAGKYDKLFPETKRITWLREPIHRLISDYCFRHISNPTKDYLNKQGLLKFAQGNSNLMAYCLNGKSLDYFDFVGITEYFEEDLLELKNILDWSDYQVIYQNRNPYPEYVAFQKEVLSDEKLMDELARANSQDMELYEAALSLGKNRRKKSSLITLEQPKFLATVGNLEEAKLQNQELFLSGWVASFNSGPVDGFQVSIAGQELTNFEQFFGLPSPDVKNIFPHLDSAEVARFRLVVPLSQAQFQQFQDSVVALTPLFDGRKGLVMVKVTSGVVRGSETVNYKIINQDDNIDGHVILPDGKSISFPPKTLITRVHGDAEISDFLQAGWQISKDIKLALQKFGKDFNEFQSVLDFGCGCGRVIIWNASENNSVSLYGTDIDTEAISWCQKNIKFAQFNVNQALPPLSYEDNQFDLIYLISVFTHLQEEMQLKWLEELERITKPGGIVLITTRRLRSPQEAVELAPKLVEKGLISVPTSGYKNVFPDWYTITLQTEDYVRNKWINLFEIIDYIPGGIRGNQNIVLLRKYLKQNFSVSPEVKTIQPEIEPQYTEFRSQKSEVRSEQEKAKSQKSKVRSEQEVRSEEEGKSAINLPEKNVVDLKPYTVPEKTKILATLGSLDKVEFDRQELLLIGWVVSRNLGVVKSFQLTIADTEIENFETALNLPSPDVRKLHPNLHNSDKARFLIKAFLNPEKISQFQNAEIVLTPIFKDGKGQVLSKVKEGRGKKEEGRSNEVRSEQEVRSEDEKVKSQKSKVRSEQEVRSEEEGKSGIDLPEKNVVDLEPYTAPEKTKPLIFSEAPIPIVQEQPKFIPPIEPITTIGHLDRVAIANQKLIISGWVGSYNFASVESFKVFIGSQEYTSFEQKLGLPSPDVAKVQTKLNNAENARFILEIPLTKAELKNCQNTLITLTPIFQGKEGEILFQLFNPSLPIPDDKYIEGKAINFIQRSCKFLGDFIQRVGLQPTAEVLEIGCGVGNIAYGLAYYLKSPGRYEGNDFSEELISWAQQNISSHKPHFNFRQIDSDLKLPYNDKSFDFVFIGSRFTQVGGKEIRNYLDEIYRVLKPDGRLLFQCFLVNHESEKLISEGKSSQPLIHRLQEGFTKDLNSPEKGMGFLESLLLEWVINAGFNVLGKYYGSWCGRVGKRSYPDMVILEKEEVRVNQEKIESLVKEEAGNKQEENLQNLEKIGSDRSSEEVREKKEKIESLLEEETVNKQEENLQDLEKIGSDRSEVLQNNLPSESTLKITPESKSSVSPLLTEIMADLEKSQIEIQEIKADLEKFKSQKEDIPVKSLFPVEPDTSTTAKKKLLTKPLEEVTQKSKPPTPPPKQKQELLGLSGVTVDKFWEIILVEGRRKEEKGKGDFSDIEGRRKEEKGKGDFSESLREGRGDYSKPSISILTPTWNSSLDWFVETVLSVLNQSIPNWEWCIVDDGSKQPEIRNILAGLAEKEPRIKVLLSEDNGGISAATNKALNMATGEYICLLDHDDTLAPTALEDSLNKLAEGFDVVYSDEDKIDFSGLNYIVPFFKPDWSPEYFRGVMYVGHLLCVRRELALTAGGFKSEFDGVQDYEFMLRVSEQTNKIAHISRHLYHWRQVKGSISGDADAKAGIEVVQQAAVKSHLQRIGLAAKAEPGLGKHRININPLPRNNHPLISLIIAAPNLSENIDKWSENLLSVSTYPKNEVILVGGEKTENIIENSAVKVLNLSGQFNYSRAYNLAAKTAQGEYFIFLNTDLEVVTEDWQRHLLYYAEQSDIGAVGGLLIFPDGIVEHAGIVLGKSGKVDYVMRGFPSNHDGYAGSLVCAREVSAVSRDCLMVSRQNFEMVGGFNEHFFSDYQDVDLCLKLRKNGKRIVFTPRSVLINHQSEKHRQRNYDVVDYMLLLDQWQIDMDLGDPYYNLNFDIQRNDYTVVL